MAAAARLRFLLHAPEPAVVNRSSHTLRSARKGSNCFEPQSCCPAGMSLPQRAANVLSYAAVRVITLLLPAPSLHDVRCAHAQLPPAGCMLLDFRRVAPHARAASAPPGAQRWRLLA